MMKIPTDVDVFDGLSDRQQLVLTTLMQTATIREAAQVTGVGESTIYKYKREPEFREAYRQLRRDRLEQARRGLEELAVAANKAFKEVLESPDSPSTAKVAAARTIWTLITRSVDDEELSDLLDELRESSNA